MAPRSKTSQPAVRATKHLRVKNLRAATAGKKIQKAALLALDELAVAVATMIYSRIEDAHGSLGHDASDKFYNSSTVATTFLDSDLGGNADRIILPKDVQPNAVTAASVEMMQRKK